MGWSEWVRTVEVEPSLYAADFAHLSDQIDVLMRAGVRIFHFDIGDGHFVEPITIGPIVLQSISKQVHDQGGVPDCHLMTETPAKHFGAIAAAGGDSVTVHYEACPDLPGVVAAARRHGLGVGLAFKPATVAGAVVVRDGAVVGEGWHDRKGGPHAEVVALEAAGERARGATLFLTMEPCAHHGSTPPCTDAVLAAGIARVVAGSLDPNPEATGGLERLSAAGIEVEH